ncbi:hypothetical protein ACSBO6_18400 [Bacillus sp. AL-1R]|nr:hypothetical protein [Bacillus sp. AFS055030]
MSKRTRTSKIDKWIKVGRGSGVGSDYSKICEYIGIVQFQNWTRGNKV